MFKYFFLILNFFKKKNKLSVFYLILFMVIGAFLEALGIVLLIPLISFMIENDLSEKFFFIKDLEIIQSLTKIELLYFCLFIFLFIMILKSLFMVFLSWYKQTIYNDLMKQISRRLFHFYLNMDYLKYLKSDSGSLIRNITKGSNDVINGYLSSCINFILEFFIIVFMSVILIRLDTLSFFFSAIFFAIIVFVYVFLTKNKLKKWGKLNMDYSAEQVKFLQYGIHGLKDIRILGKSEIFIKNYINFLNRTNIINAKLKVFEEIPRYLFELLFVVIISLFIYYQVSIKSNSPSEVLVLLAIFAAISFKLVPSINRIVRTTQAIKFNTPLTKVILDELNFSQNYDDVKYLEQEKIFNFSQIEFKDVSFSYKENEKNILDKINYKFLNNRKIAISGKSGSGKTTMIDLFTGLLKPSSGSILIDSQNLINKKKSWQNIIGYVPQTVYLLNESLKRNIAFELDDEKIDEEKVELIIKKTQLSGLVDRMKDGVNTNIGDKGSNLSGGEKQRIGIARCLYRDPKIIIMDEATASLDTDTERLILKEILDNLSKDRLIIMISHKKELIKEFCDEVILIDQGRIIN
tara:strand:+ start:248 stop:1978 length:1731 start_codon:yes stop_codon:yes gene_type:complete